MSQLSEPFCLEHMISRDWMARQMSYTDDFETHRSLCQNQSVLFDGHPRMFLYIFMFSYNFVRTISFNTVLQPYYGYHQIKKSV